MRCDCGSTAAAGPLLPGLQAEDLRRRNRAPATAEPRHAPDRVGAQQPHLEHLAGDPPELEPLAQVAVAPALAHLQRLLRELAAGAAAAHLHGRAALR